MSASSMEEEKPLTIEQIEKQITETQLIKHCVMYENNHIHHFHEQELDDVTQHYKPEKSANVEELFFDLVFVGAGGNITHGLRMHHFTWEEYFLYMGVILIFWKNFSVNRSIFDTSDLLDKFLAMWYGAGVVGLTVFSTNGLHGDTCGYFAYCCNFLSLVQLSLDLRGFYGMTMAIRSDKRADHREKKAYKYMIAVLIVDCTKIILWFIFNLIDDAEGRRPILWICSLLPMIIDVIFCFIFTVDQQIMTPVAHLIERFEGIVLIMLGETIISITPALTYTNTNSSVVMSIVCSYLIMYLYKTFKFDVEEYNLEVHALYFGGLRRVVWMYCTILECVGIILFGAGCGELVDGIVLKTLENAHATGDEAPGHRGLADVQNLYHAVRRILSGGGEEPEGGSEQMLEMAIKMLCVGVGVALTANSFCRLAHKIELKNFEGAAVLWYVQVVFQFITICFVFPIPFLFTHVMMSDESHHHLISVVIIVILFVIDILFFMDEILENISLKKLLAKMIVERNDQELDEESALM